jgi:DNA-directed RNA polymerase subunit M/transcription elongation factor TFIIS
MDSVCVPASSPSHDIVFDCTHCAGALVVDAAAAGMMLTCQHCGKPTSVPQANLSTRRAEQVTELHRKLNENEAQRTEVTSYINQLCIQVHRWKLRLQTLNERKAELESELASVSATRSR